MRKQEKLLTGIKNVDLMILAKLNDKDLVSIWNTSKRAGEICSDENFWRNRILVKYPEVGYDIFKQYKGKRTWADYYVHDLVKIKTKNAQAVFRQTSKNGRLDHVIIALSKNHKNYDDVLRFASYYGHLEVVKYFIDEGADIHADDDCALRFSSMKGHLEIVKFLIESGANIHAEDDEALQYASRYGHLDIVKFLIEYGANIHADNDAALRFLKDI